MNCVFICVFNNPNYVNMLYLLLDSIYSYGLLNKGLFEILIYTSSKFMDIIKKSPFYKEGLIRFEINDGYGSIEKACKARLDLFDLLVDTMNNENKYNYNKILYLDTDIIVKGNIQTIFDVCVEDKLYVLEEGSISSDNDFWGKSLFLTAGDLELYSNSYCNGNGNSYGNGNAFSTAFSTGIMLFNNSDKMKCFFSEVKQDFKKRPFTFYCQDQPYIVYNAFKYALYDNQALKPFVVNNDHDVYSSKIIHHFPGDPGRHQNKMAHMIRFLSGLKTNVF